MHTLSSLRACEPAGIERLELSCGLTEFPREIACWKNCRTAAIAQKQASSVVCGDMKLLAALAA